MVGILQYMNSTIMGYFCIIFISIIAVVMYAVIINSRKRFNQLQKYSLIDIGMPEKEMRSIMGKGFNKSLLKNNRAKYEWRINSVSYRSSFNGVGIRYYSGVKKVVIYVKDGFVEEVRPYNV